MASRPNIRVRVNEDTRGQNLTLAAPSFVNARDESAVAAAQLADALGLGIDMAAEEREERRQEGLRDAALGQVDEDRAARQRAYREAVEITQAESGWLHTRAAIAERLEKLDIMSIPPDQQAETIDAIIDEELRNAYGDPTQPQLSTTEASAIAPRIAEFRAKAHEALIEKNRELVYASTLSEMRDSLALRLEDGPLTAEGIEQWYGLFRERLGKSRATQEAALGVLAQLAIETKNADILEAVPERWADGAPSFRTDALLAPKFQQALDDARTAQSNEEEKKQRQARMDTYVALYEDATVGRLDIDEVNRAAALDEFGNSLISEAQAVSLRTLNANARLRQLAEPSYKELIASGNAFLIGTRDKQLDALEAFVNDYPPEQRTAVAIERGINNGIMLRQHQNLLNMANPSDPEKLTQAVELADLYDAQQPGFIEAFVQDQAMRRINAYRALRSAGWTHEKAIEDIDEADWRLVDEVDSSERRAALATALETVKDVPWTINNLEQNPALNRQVRELFETYVAFNMPPEMAAEAAIKHLQRSAVYVDGYIYHANSGWPPNEAQEAADAFVAAHIPEGEDPDEWRLVKAVEPGYVRLERVDDYLPGESSRIKVRISDVADWWNEDRARRFAEAEAERWAEREAKYRQRAMDLVYPVRFTGDATADSVLRSEQEAYWNSLTEQERHAALREIQRQEERRVARQRQQRKAFTDAFRQFNSY